MIKLHTSVGSIATIDACVLTEDGKFSTKQFLPAQTCAWSSRLANKKVTHGGGKLGNQQLRICSLGHTCSEVIGNFQNKDRSGSHDVWSF